MRIGTTARSGAHACQWPDAAAEAHPGKQPAVAPPASVIPRRRPLCTPRASFRSHRRVASGLAYLRPQPPGLPAPRTHSS
uniref:Uncharacterized protein n=1 Tax=Aegilops tauschii subsp. strangulata TaxID=200361 RepID=A0A453KC33_AEGTS